MSLWLMLGILVGGANAGLLLFGAAVEANDVLRRRRRAARQQRIGREIAERSWSRPAEIRSIGGAFVSEDRWSA